MRHAQTILLAVLILGFAGSAFAQEKAAKPARNHRVVVYGGIGPNYYFNNLVLAKNKVNEFNYSFVARVMWEPEHLLSIGFETGYFRLYSLKGSAPATGDIRIVNVAIPIQLVVSMKFMKHYYANFSMGQSLLLNNVSTANTGSFDASTVSLGDFGATVGYRKPLTDRTFIGVETKGYYSSKLNDKNIALLFMVSYKL